MKKNFFKKLALVLALVMVATSINYVPASAAKAPAWKAKKTVISLGNTYTYGVKNVSSKYKVTYTSSKTSVGTINKTSGKFTAKKAGKTNVHAIVKNGSKTVKDLVQKVEVKAPAWKNTKSTMEAGERSTFTVTYKASGSTQKWSSSNKEVAKVSSKGSVLAVGVGTATITTKVYDKNGKRLKTLKTDVTVSGLQLASAAQKSVTKIAAKFSGSMKDEKVAASDFTVVREDNAVFTIKEIEVDKADPSIIYVETYNEMKDGKQYTVTYDEKEVKFTATEGNVADIAVTPSVVTAGKKRDVSVQTLDSNGIILSDEKIDSVSNNLELNVNPNNGYLDGSKIYLPEIGNTATVKVTYHTYKYDETGKETGAIEKEFTITAVADDATVSNYKVTVVNGENAPAWSASTFEANNKVIIGEEPKAYILIKDSNDEEIADDEYPNYKVVSSDTSKLLVDETTLTYNSSSKEGSDAIGLVGVAEGTAYIIIKDAEKDTTLTTLPIVVTAKKKLVTMEIDKTSVSVANAQKTGTEVTVKAKDQYGNRITDDITYTDTTVSKPSGASDVSLSQLNAIDPKNGKIKVNGDEIYGAGKKTGTYRFKITATFDGKSISRELSVRVVEVPVGANASYELQLSTTSADTTVTKDTTEATTVEVKLAEKKSGVVTGYVDAASVDSITIKKSNGDVIASKGGTKPVTCDAITSFEASGLTLVNIKASEDTTSGNKEFLKNLDPGTYTVSVEYETTDEKGNKTKKSFTKSFTVKDSQAKADKVKFANKDALDAGGSTAKDHLISAAGNDDVTISYNGIKQSNIEIRKIEGTEMSSGNSVYVKRILVKVSIPESPNYVYVWMDVNNTLKNCSGLE